LDILVFFNPDLILIFYKNLFHIYNGNVMLDIGLTGVLASKSFRSLHGTWEQPELSPRLRCRVKRLVSFAACVVITVAGTSETQGVGTTNSIMALLMALYFSLIFRVIVNSCYKLTRWYQLRSGIRI